MSEAPRWSRREAALLAVVFALFFLLFNQLNFSRGRWTLHPDDKNLYVFSNVLLESGHLWYQSPLNLQFDTNAFVPALDEYVSEAGEGERMRAPYSPGVFFLICAGNLLGYRGPFFIVSLAGLAGLLFLYLTVRRLYGIKAAALSLLLLGSSAAYIYWSNMLFSNIPALAFTLGGVYFVVMAVARPQRLRYYLLAAAFFAASIWIRYEFVVFAALAMLPPLRNFRKLKLKNVLFSLAFLGVLGGLILLLNHVTTGSLFGVPQKAGATAAEYLVNYPARFRGFEVLFANGKMYVYAVAPLLTVLGVLGLLHAIKNERSVYVLLFALAGALVFYYYGNNIHFWGYGKYWLAASYTRYFLPLFTALAFFAALFLTGFLGRLPWRRSTLALLTFLVIATHAYASFSLLSRADFGLSYTRDYMEGRRSVDDFARTLPRGAIIVDLSDGWFEKMVLSRTVFVPARIKKGEEAAREEAAAILGALLEEGRPLYVLSTPERGRWHRQELEEMGGGFALEPLAHDIVFKKGGGAPEVFRLKRMAGSEGERVEPGNAGTESDASRHGGGDGEEGDDG